MRSLSLALTLAIAPALLPAQQSPTSAPLESARRRPTSACAAPHATASWRSRSVSPTSKGRPWSWRSSTRPEPAAEQSKWTRTVISTRRSSKTAEAWSSSPSAPIPTPLSPPGRATGSFRSCSRATALWLSAGNTEPWRQRARLTNRNLFVVGPDGKIAYRAIPFREMDASAYKELGAAIQRRK